MNPHKSPLERLQSHLQNIPTPVSPSAIFRLWHGRGGLDADLAQFNLDRVGEYIVVEDYGLAPELAQSLKTMLGDIFPAQKIIWHWRRERRWQEQVGTIIVSEGPLSFEVHLGETQNYGFFVDMASVRERLCRGHLDAATSWPVSGEWLNFFSYTGALSCALLKGGARRVTNVDSKANVLDWSKRNHALNTFDSRSSLHLKMDAMDFRARPGVLYDGVVIDPPQRQRDSFDAAKDYPKLLKRIGSMLRPGGALIATHNDPMVARETFLTLCLDSIPGLTWREDLPIPVNHAWAKADERPSFLLFQWRQS